MYLVNILLIILKEINYDLCINEYNELKFLEHYNFKVENHSNGRYIEICLVNDDVCIVYLRT